VKKILPSIFLLTVVRCICCAQDSALTTDSLNKTWHESILHDLDTARQDTSRVLLTAELANYFKFYLPDSALFYAYKALALARQIKFPKGEARALLFLILAQYELGNDSKALQISLQGLKLAEKNNLMYDEAHFLHTLGNIYNETKNPRKALDILNKSKVLFDSIRDFTYSTMVQNHIGDTYLRLNQSDSALDYCQLAYKNAVKINEEWLKHEVLISLGKIQDKKGNVDLALAYFRQSVAEASEAVTLFGSYFSIAQLYQKTNTDSCIYYAKKSLEIVQGKGFNSSIVDATILLSNVYADRDPQKALQYSKLAIAYKDSLFNLGRTSSLENSVAFDEQERQYEIEIAETAYRNQVKQFAFISGLLVFLLIVYILYRNNRHKQKAYALLQKQKQETDVQRAKAERTLHELKSTQAQLIQSEKMASLGELTAGVAHEIQNPLNFVNNFSDVNQELLTELRDEANKGNLDEVKSIASSVIENELKINHHGKRADAIVKGMLQHARTSSGQKEPTDINKLADEYLRLAYQRFRAKDKSFNATFATDFDQTIGKVNVIPQEIGRVILNLINNAFYAVHEKQKQNLNGHEPTVSVSTKRNAGTVAILVKDNGNGIPQKILDKIFQPFFTTKPTGQGTGLGLSLAYDIVKAHGGEIKVQTKEGEGSEFIIHLPET